MNVELHHNAPWWLRSVRSMKIVDCCYVYPVTGEIDYYSRGNYMFVIATAALI